MAPFNGKIRKTGGSQITIEADDLQDIDVIIDNIDLDEDRKSSEVLSRILNSPNETNIGILIMHMCDV